MSAVRVAKEGTGGGGTSNHDNLSNIRAVDPTSTDTTRNKHVSNADEKANKDHRDAAAPHSGHATTQALADGLAGKVSTDALTELVEDIVGAMAQAGAGATVSYNDAAGTLTISATGGGGATDPEVVRDTIGAALVEGAGIDITVNDAADTITIAGVNATTLAAGLMSAADKTKLDGVEANATADMTPEELQDAISSAIAHANHQNLTATYDDANNRFVLSVAAPPTTEEIQDAVSSMLAHAGHTNISAVYNDAANRWELTATGGTVTGAISGTFNTIAALQAGALTNGQQYFVKGYYEVGDGGGDVFEYDSASTATVDGLFVFAHNTLSGRILRRMTTGVISSIKAGVKCVYGADNSWDDLPRLQAWFNAGLDGTPLVGVRMPLSNSTGEARTTGKLTLLSNFFDVDMGFIQVRSAANTYHIVSIGAGTGQSGTGAQQSFRNFRIKGIAAASAPVAEGTPRAVKAGSPTEPDYQAENQYVQTGLLLNGVQFGTIESGEIERCAIGVGQINGCWGTVVRDVRTQPQTVNCGLNITSPIHDSLTGEGGTGSDVHFHNCWFGGRDHGICIAGGSGFTFVGGQHASKFRTAYGSIGHGVIEFGWEYYTNDVAHHPNSANLYETQGCAFIGFSCEGSANNDIFRAHHPVGLAITAVEVIGRTTTQSFLKQTVSLGENHSRITIDACTIRENWGGVKLIDISPTRLGSGFSLSERNTKGQRLIIPNGIAGPIGSVGAEVDHICMVKQSQCVPAHALFREGGHVVEAKGGVLYRTNDSTKARQKSLDWGATWVTDEASGGSAPGQATETTAGIAQVATQAKTNAGTDDQSFITSAKLAAYPGLSAGHDPITTAVFIEDFRSGGASGTTGVIGENGWLVSTGSLAYDGGSTNHPGVVKLSTNGTAGANAALYGRATPSAGVYDADDFFDATFVFRIPASTDMDSDTQIRVGLMTNPTLDPGDHGVYFEKLYADVDWFGVTRSSAAQSRSAGVAALATGWHKLRIRRINSTTIGFTVDGGTEVTANTNVTGFPLTPVVQIKGQTTAVKNVDVDLVVVKLTGLTR